MGTHAKGVPKDGRIEDARETRKGKTMTSKKTTKKALKIAVDAKVLKALANWCAGKNDTRHGLKGIHYENGALIATDSYRAVAFYPHGFEAFAGIEDGLIIPAEVVERIRAKDKTVTITQEGVEFAGQRFGYVQASYPKVLGVFDSTPRTPYAPVVNSKFLEDVARLGTAFGERKLEIRFDGHLFGETVGQAGAAKFLVMPITLKDGHKSIRDAVQVDAPAWKRNSMSQKNSNPKDSQDYTIAVKDHEGNVKPVVEVRHDDITKPKDSKPTPKKATLAKNSPKKDSKPKDSKPESITQSTKFPASPEAIKKAEELAGKYDGLKFKATPICVWVTGDSKKFAASLKAEGLKWSRKKSAWYFRVAA